MKKHAYVKKYFSLIELLIVIAIIGALSAMIIPAFSSSEKDSKESADAYNNRGILRYIHMFKDANGYFPSGFHTGLSTSGAALTTLSEAFGEAESDAMELNDTFSVTTLSNTAATEDDSAKLYITSLKEAGINYLTAGEVSDATATPLKDSTSTVSVLKVDPSKFAADEEPVFNGRKLSAYLKPLQFEMGEHEDNGIIVALFVTPNIDWETVYSGGYHQHEDHGHFESRTASKIALKNTPVSNVSDADFKYFVCFFKLSNDGSAAQLIGITSPELTVVE